MTAVPDTSFDPNDYDMTVQIGVNASGTGGCLKIHGGNIMLPKMPSMLIQLAARLEKELEARGIESEETELAVDIAKFYRKKL